MSDPAITTSQAAKWLTDRGIKVAAVTVQNWCRSRTIAHLRLPSGQYRVRVSTLTTMLANAGIRAEPEHAAA